MKKFLSVMALLCLCANLSSCGEGASEEKSSAVNSETSSSVSSEAENSEDKLSESADESSEASLGASKEDEKEEQTEIATERPTRSDAEKSDAAKKMAENYLNKVDMYVLDFEVMDAEAANFDASLDLYSKDYEGVEKATMITVAFDYHADTSFYVYSQKMVDGNGEKVLQTYDSTNWRKADVNGNYWGIVRYRLVGEYSQDDLKVRLVYNGDGQPFVDRDLSNNTSFEEIAKKYLWREEYYKDSDKDDIDHPYIYKINGIYCLVDETGETESGMDSGYDGRKVMFASRDFGFYPLQGAVGPVLSQEEVGVKSGHIADYTFCDPDGFINNGVRSRVVVKIGCVVSETDWYENFDELPEEKRQGKKTVDGLVNKYLHEEARASYITTPDGDGGITKIPCAFK